MKQPAAPGDHGPFGRTSLLVFCLFALSVSAIFAFLVPPLRVGDAQEYLLMTRALASHGSPEIRESDVDAVHALLTANGQLRGGLKERDQLLRNSFTADSGGTYFAHFWLYPLLCVPAWLLLGAVGGNEMAALQATNVLCFFLAAGLVLFQGRTPRRDRLLLLGLSAVGPVLWYLRWPHPEAFTWSAVLAAVVLLREDRFVWAALAASLGAMQNPPLVLLALLAVALAATSGNRRQTGAAAISRSPSAAKADRSAPPPHNERVLPLRAAQEPPPGHSRAPRSQEHFLFLATKPAKTCALAVLAASLSLLPVLFCLALFGVPNLIIASGSADPSRISAGRVWSLLADLDQGMLPFVPAALLLSLAGGAVALVRRRARGVLVLAVFLGMALLSGMQTNWNGGSAGMMRYAVWLVPLLAWLAVDQLPRRRSVAWLAAAGLLLQAVIVLNGSSEEDYLRQSAPARFVLTHAPRLYSPVPQVFAERQLGHEVVSWAGQLPVPFVTGDGAVTKILVDRGVHDDLRSYFAFERDDPWLRKTEAEKRDDQLYYLHPPAGALRVVDEKGVKPDVFRTLLLVRLVACPARVSGESLDVTVEIANQGPHRYWGERSCTPVPLKLGYRIYQGEKTAGSGRGAMPFLLGPHGKTVRRLRIALPPSAGTYRLEIGTLLERVAWSDHAVSLRLESMSGEDGNGWSVTGGLTDSSQPSSFQ